VIRIYQTMKPVFYASEIAALIGKNPYKSSNEALFRLLSTNPKWACHIAAVKKETGFQTEKDVVESASFTIKESIKKAVDHVVVNTNVEATIASFQEDATKTLLTETLEGKHTLPEFVAAAERITNKTSTIEKEVVALQNTQTVNILGREIQKQRGTRLEGPSEDSYGGITNRGDAGRVETPNYIIVGYIDGQKNGRVVETKNRKRFWKEPPPYDIIQLRCYMKMKGEINGTLLEFFPLQQPRETHIDWDSKIWDTIHQSLENVASKLKTITASEITELMKTDSFVHKNGK
jgi:hypothetical protein